MSAPPPEVVVVGNAGVDTCVYPYGDEIDWSVEANFTENLDTVGQAGGYASRGYARLGRRTAFVGHVGADAAGDLVRRTLERDGVDTRALFVDPAGTARSVNFMYRDGRRKNFYDGKGHMTLRPDLEACREVMDGARLAHFNLPNWGRTLLPAARELGLTVACDLQDVVDPADPYRRDFVEAADVVLCSAANHEPERLVAALWERRPGLVVVVGMGARGCALGAGGAVRRFPPVPSDRPVVDTNGAGDGLAVGFLTSFVLEGRTIEESVLRGQILARHTCTLRGTSEGLLDAAGLEGRARDLVGR
jgi:sugar/nucleoside kinase (ribokinase family)